MTPGKAPHEELERKGESITEEREGKIKAVECMETKWRKWLPVVNLFYSSFQCYENSLQTEKKGFFLVAY